jgi:hypothetical protein
VALVPGLHVITGCRKLIATALMRLPVEVDKHARCSTHQYIYPGTCLLQHTPVYISRDVPAAAHTSRYIQGHACCSTHHYIYPLTWALQLTHVYISCDVSFRSHKYIYPGTCLLQHTPVYISSDVPAAAHTSIYIQGCACCSTHQYIYPGTCQIGRAHV